MELNSRSNGKKAVGEIGTQIVDFSENYGQIGAHELGLWAGG